MTPMGSQLLDGGMPRCLSRSQRLGSMHPPMAMKEEWAKSSGIRPWCAKGRPRPASALPALRRISTDARLRSGSRAGRAQVCGCLHVQILRRERLSGKHPLPACFPPKDARAGAERWDCDDCVPWVGTPDVVARMTAWREGTFCAFSSLPASGNHCLASSANAASIHHHRSVLRRDRHRSPKAT